MTSLNTDNLNKQNLINSSRTNMLKTGNATVNVAGYSNLKDSSSDSSTLLQKNENNTQKRPPLPQMPLIFQSHNHHLVGGSGVKHSVLNLEDSNTNQHHQRFSNETSTDSDILNLPSQTSQCFIYGISNKAFVDDLHHQNTIEKQDCFNKNTENYIPSSY